MINNHIHSIEDTLWCGVNRKRLKNILDRIVTERFEGNHAKATKALSKFEITFPEDFFKRQSLTPWRRLWRHLFNVESDALLGHQVFKIAQNGFGMSERKAKEFTAQWSLYQAGGWMRAGWRVNVQRLSEWFSAMAESMRGESVGPMRTLYYPQRLIARAEHQLAQGLEPLHTYALITHLASYWDYMYGDWYAQISETVADLSAFEMYGQRMEDVVRRFLLCRKDLGAANLFDKAGSIFDTMSPIALDPNVKMFRAFHDVIFASLISDALPRMDEVIREEWLESARDAAKNAVETFDILLGCTQAHHVLQNYAAHIAHGLAQASGIIIV